MTKIHHATRALATKHGVEIIEADGEFRLVNLETGMLSEDSFATTGEISEELRRNGSKEIVWETPKAAPGQRSGVMGIGYHRAYSANPHGPGCNDSVDLTLREQTAEFDEQGQPTGKMSLPKLHEIGAATGLFRREWESLNPGMQRMNLANRIRGWLRNNAGDVSIGDQTGRFGVEQTAPKAKKEKAPKGA